MAYLTEQDWVRVKVRFESTEKADMSIDAIAKEFGVSKGAVSQHATAGNWTRGKFKQAKQITAKCLNEVKASLPAPEQDFFEAEILSEAKLLNAACLAQHSLLTLVTKSVNQVNAVLDNSPDGLYVASEGSKGTRYGRTTEFVRDLAAAMPAANAILGHADKQNTNNVQVNSSAPLVINFNPVKKLNE